MKREHLTVLQNAQLEIAKKFKQICEENNLRYYLVFGSLLGAVRHENSIPWDYDIDFCMPKKDYDKFISLIKDDQDEVFGYAFRELNQEFNLLHGIMYLKNTTLEHKNGMRFEKWNKIYIDIFPLYKMTNDSIVRTRTIKRAKKLFSLARLRKKVDNRVPRAKWKVTIKKLIYYSLFFLQYGKLMGKIDKLLSSFENTPNSDYLTDSFIVFTKNENGVFHKKIYGDGAQFKYADATFNGPVDYDAYLKAFYSDYMKYPDEKERYKFIDGTTFTINGIIYE